MPSVWQMVSMSVCPPSYSVRASSNCFGSARFFGRPPRRPLARAGAAPAAWEEGIYRPEWTKATYDRLFALAEASLANGMPVVLDATFLDADQRTGAADVATRAGTRLVLVETVCDEATIATRLAARADRGDSTSDATLATYRRQVAALSGKLPFVPPGAVIVQGDTASGMPGVLDPVFATLVQQGIALPIVPTVSAYTSGH